MMGNSVFRSTGQKSINGGALGNNPANGAHNNMMENGVRQNDAGGMGDTQQNLDSQ